MNKLKKVFKLIALTLVLSLAATSILPITNATVAQAATTGLNYKSLTLEVGKTAVLKMENAGKNVKWTTSNKKIATVSKSGTVKAVKAGKATITATVNKKKYTCAVTVKEANPYIANAPFKAKEAAFGKLKSVMPKDWTCKVMAQQGNSIAAVLYPSSADVNKQVSNVYIAVEETGKAQQDYSLTKGYYDSAISQDLIKSQLTQQGIDPTITDYQVSDYKTALGTAYKVAYTATYTGGMIKQNIYYLYIDNYVIQLNTTDIGDNITPEVGSVGEYILNSIQAAK